MKNLFTRGCLCIALVLGYGLSGIAQNSTGMPPYTVSQGGPDSIDPANLNIHLTIPIMNKAGRKLPLILDLGYDSSIWMPLTNYMWAPRTTNQVAVTGVPMEGGQVWGWTKLSNAMAGGLSYWLQVYPCYDDSGDYVGERDLYVEFTYYDARGTSHEIGGTAAYAYGDPDWCDNSDFPATGTAEDGSGYYMNFDPAGAQTVTTLSGTVISPPIMDLGYAWFGGFNIQDTNGNQISSGSGGAVNDTLSGTSAAITFGGSGTPSSPETYTYTAPSGASATYTVNYTNYNIHTNFGCPSLSEYAASGVPLAAEIDLPDVSAHASDKYLITYEDTPGWTGYKTGRIASITFPTGGTIHYYYPGDTGYTGTVSSTHNGIECADGSTAGLTRVTPDGTWNYSRTLGSGAASTTAINDPQGNTTEMLFQGMYPTETDVISSLGVLKTIYTCYNGSAPSCNGTAITLPIASLAEYVKWPGSGNLESKTVTSFNTNSLITEVDEYGYGPGSPGSVARKTLTSYNTTLTNNIRNRPSQIKVEDGSNAVKAQTTYSYDETSVAPTSAPQHVSITGSRGNVTTIASLVSGTTALSKTFTYYDTGTVNTSADVNGSATTYTYGTGSCGNSFSTSVSEPLSLMKSMTWNCTGGVATSGTDENGNPASTSYTNAYFWRPDSGTDQLLNATTFTYAGPNSVESKMDFNSTSTTDALKTTDSLGRPHISQIRKGPGSTTLDSVETDYNFSTGTVRTSLPYIASDGDPCSGTCYFSTTTIDPLGRPTLVKDASSNTVMTYSYSNNDVYQTAGPAPTGENAKRKQLEYDALGRLTSVCEVTSGTTAWPSGTCSQTSSVAGYWTTYTYNVNNKLMSVTQNAQGTSQTRSYSYDDLGRMTSETNPENGTTNYVYDSDSTCGTYKGDLVKKTDAVGNVICFAYDALHRVTSMTYPTYATVTPERHFVYDSATVNSVTMSNAKTHLAEAYTCTSCPGTKLTDTGFSYTARGETSDLYQSTPHSSAYFHSAVTYWANGLMDSLTGALGYSTSYEPDGEGRVNSVALGNQLASTTYNAAGQPTAVNFASGDSDTFTYDPATGRMSQYSFNVNGSSVLGALTWNALGTLATLAITDPFNGSNAQTCTASHDDLSRISAWDCGSSNFGQSYTYDPFGNITKNVLSLHSGTFFAPTYSITTNHMTLIGSSMPTYDADGNPTNDTMHSYTWDSNGKPVTIDGVNLTYDALGNMVEQNRSGVYTEIQYSPTGFKMLTMNGSSLGYAVVPMPGGISEVWTGSATYYRHSDWLGSSRLASKTDRSVYFDGAYGPFGEEYATSGTTDLSFTGMRQDTVSADYDFPAREYGIQGRWVSPDPAGISSVDGADPQTWNRYAYVRNSPLQLTDPTGLAEKPKTRSVSEGDPDDGDGGGGGCSVDGMDMDCGIALSLLSGGVALECPDNSCEADSPTGLPMQYHATANGGFFSCSLTGEYASQQAAGTAGAGCGIAPSVASLTEHSGNIYQIDSNGKYSFTLPQSSGLRSDAGPWDPTNIPDGTTYAGFYHTHPYEAPGNIDEQFSGADIYIDQLPINLSFPTYLGTPSGRILMYNPLQFSQPNGCVVVGSAVPIISGNNAPIPVCSQ